MVGFMKRNLHNILSKSLLIKEYLTNKKTQQNIANDYSVTQPAIAYLVNKYQLKRKRRSYKGKNNPMYGKKHSRCSINKNIQSNKHNWKNIKFKESILKKSFKNRNLSPNLCEQKLKEVLELISYKQFKFVGNGYTFIGGFNPDFIDFKSKKIIEMYGYYWHNRPKTKERDKQRIKMYNKHRYSVLVIWQNELKDLDYLAGKIMLFLGV